MKKLFLSLLLSISTIAYGQTLLDETGDAFIRNSSSTSSWNGTTNLTLRATAAQTSGFTLSYEADSNPRVGRLTLNNNWGGVYGDFAISLRTGSGTSERFRVKHNGNVGIGTNNPSSELEIASNSGVPRIRLTRAHGVSQTYQIGLEDTDNGFLSIKDMTDGVDRLVIDGNGNVGIRTTSPERSLEIGNKSSYFSAYGRFGGGWSTEFERHARLEFNDKNFGIGAGKISTSTANDDDLYLWSYNGAGRDISFLSTSDGESDPATWSHNMIIKGANGFVGIGTTNPDEKLVVDGKIRSEEIKVEVVNGPDYVFASGYQLPTLQETKEYISQNQHLPEIPSAKEMETNGINLGEMNMKLLKKIEELTLYLIEQESRILKLENQLSTKELQQKQ